MPFGVLNIIDVLFRSAKKDMVMESGGHTPVTSLVTSRTATPSNLSANSANQTNDNDKRTKICVYCGSSPGHNPAHMEAARQLARVMAANDIALGV
jgi:hypothetical protein